MAMLVMQYHSNLSSELFHVVSRTCLKFEFVVTCSTLAIHLSLAYYNFCQEEGVTVRNRGSAYLQQNPLKG